MFLIIIWHIIIHGKLLENCQNQTITLLLILIQYMIVIHVNSFIMVTGYFQSQSKFKFKKLLKLILQVIFYSIIIYIIGIKTGLIEEYDYLTIFDKFNLNALGEYWFITPYIILYIFSDYINKFINSLDKKQLYKFLTTGFIILSVIPIISRGIILDNDGYNFFHFIYIYIIGASLRKFPLKDSYYFKKFSIKEYRIILLVIFIVASYLNYSFMIVGYNFGELGTLSSYIKNIMIYNTLAYSNPFIIIQTIAFFELFNTIDIKNKVINFISKYVLGIYLFHDNIIIRENIYKILKIDQKFNNGTIFIKIIISAIIIFILGITIDFIRDKLFILISKIKKIKLKNKTKK